MTVCVLGSGSWGTALAQHLSRNGINVRLWGRNEEELRQISERRENRKYLPGVSLSERISTTSDLKEASEAVALVVFALPSSATREVAEKLKPLLRSSTPIVSTAKGLEAKTNKRVSEILEDVLGKERPLSILSGPSFALELAKGFPTAVVLASKGAAKSNKEVEVNGIDESNVDPHYNALTHVARLFHRGTLRVYTSSDTIGVELGGILKNMISLAAGIGDGLGLGYNARAALLTRGLKEITKLIELEGGSTYSVNGLSGLGDLILTATGDLSRNRRFGILLGQGLSIEEAKEKVGQTIEAITSAEAASALAHRHQMEAPITEQINAIIKGETTPARALQDLLTRQQKAE